MPRPTKLDPIIPETLQSLYKRHPVMPLALTDEDLVFTLNDELRPAEQISYRTFQRYKQYAMRYGMDETPKDIDPMYEEMYRVIKRISITQKVELVHRMLEGTYQETQKCKWILERKFPEFSLAQINRKAEAEAKQFEAMESKQMQQKEEPIPTPEPEEEMIFTDEFGNALNDWKPDMTPREDELPLIPADEQKRAQRRYYEDFRGLTLDRPNYKDAYLKNYWPEGFEKPIVDEHDLWWSDEKNPPRWPENSVHHHSMQKEEREGTK